MMELSEQRLLKLDDSLTGLCRVCQTEAVVPNAHTTKQLCSRCGHHEVYAVQELLIRGFLRLSLETEAL